MQQWEQRVIHATSSNWKTLDKELQRLGAEGWEAVSVAGSDKTVGVNALMVIVRRQLVPPAPPAAVEAEWHPDPCGRWDKRYWNGQVWTAHVANVETRERGLDPPQTLPTELN